MHPQIRVRSVQADPMAADFAGTYKFTTGSRDDYIREEYQSYWNVASTPGDVLDQIREAAGQKSWYDPTPWDTDDLDRIIHDPKFDPNKSKGVAFQADQEKKAKARADAAAAKVAQEAQAQLATLAQSAQEEIAKGQAALAAAAKSGALWKYAAGGAALLAVGIGIYYATRKK